MFVGNHAFGNGQLLSLNQSTDKLETNLYAPFVIHGFDVSWNKQLITEEICTENMMSLVGQPVLVKYYNEGNKEKDHLGNHEVYRTKNRDTGEDIMATDTIAIGVFNSVEIKEMTIDGKTGRYLIGYAQLWKDRFYNICSLLNEWLEKEIPIYCSCEYIFKNYEVKDGIQYIKSPYSYTGHVILNSEEKDGYEICMPAYDEARMLSWNEALHKDQSNEQSINESESNVVKNVFLSSLNDISFGEIRNGIYSALEKVMIAAEYNYLYLSNYCIFDDYFLYEIYNQETEQWDTYKVNYTKENDVIVCDYENRVKVEYTMVEQQVVQNQVEAAVNQVKAELETQINSLNVLISEKETELNSLKEENVSQKENVVVLNETIAQLNGKIESLNEYKEKYEIEQYNTALENTRENYKTKFEKLNALEKFNTEEVQGLIADTLDSEKSLNAKNSLSDILLDLIDTVPVKHSVNTRETSFVENGTGLGDLLKRKKVIKDTDIYEGKFDMSISF